MPLSMMDRVLACSDDSIATEKAVTGREKYFQDHFPQYPVLPGVLMLEGLAQAAGAWIRKTEGFIRSQTRLTRLQSAKFNELVRPPALMRFECRLDKREQNRYEFQGKAFADGKPVMAARFEIE